MWVFDGEQWTEEGASEAKRNVNIDMINVRIEQFVPELQVVEVVPTPRKNPIPPYPLH
jgi:hypothetical protein